MPVNQSPSVLWREGMFLCPQHLQAFHRELEGRIHTGEVLGRPGGWGILSLSIDGEALERDVLRIAECRAVFRDGTLAAFPENSVVAQREFTDSLKGTTLDVHLGIPAHQPGVSELDDSTGKARYQATFQNSYDANRTNEARDIEFRILQGRLFFGDEDRSGHETIPIARIERRGRPVAVSVLSEVFVPPLLECGGSGALMKRLIELAEAVRAQSRDLAARIPNTTALSSVEKGADIAGFVKLQAVNQTVAQMEQMTRVPELHPYEAYMTLVQAVGNLAIFGSDRMVPKLPAYDHNDLEAGFGRLIETVHSLIPAEVTVPYDTIAFQKDPVREGFFLCDVPAEWFEKNPLIFLGVELAKPAEDVVRLVGTGLKLLAESDLDRVLQGVVPGIQIEHVRTAPLAFPKRPDLHFFRIDSEGDSRAAWLKVVEAEQAVVLSALGAEGDVGLHLYAELRGS